MGGNVGVFSAMAGGKLRDEPGSAVECGDGSLLEDADLFLDSYSTDLAAVNEMGRSGLGVADRWLIPGESGTLCMMASSGTSSSESWYSASSSFTDFRLGCQDCRRGANLWPGECVRIRRGGKAREEELSRLEGVGEGERDRVPDPRMVGREGDDGLVKPRRICFPFGRLRDDCSRTASFTWLFRLGYCGREVLVRSLNPLALGVVPQALLPGCGDLCAIFLGNDARLPVLRVRVWFGSGGTRSCTSSRAMSSK